MKGFEWCNFEWDKSQFPDPPAMLKRLHENKGLKTCVWINPYVGQRSKLFDEGMKNGYFIKKTDGSVFQCDEWQPGMAIVDFTNPEACKWYAGYLRKLCEMGVDTFKTDFGERIPTRDVVYYDGSDPIKMHNFYTYLYNECVFNVLKEYFGENKACLFARSATAGGQKFPVHWGGDCSGNYNSMAEVVRGCLSLCISGFGYTSHDMAGFEATATPDIYKRWAAFGMFSSHSRLHGNQSYRVPWLFDEESCDVLRFFTKLKGKLMPYLWAQAIKTHEVGVPVMRAMVIDFADDPTCLTLDRQYMFGDNILVAPILNDEGIAEYYVPEGKWTDIITGKVLEGGKWYKHKCSYFEIPALAKPNSIIAYGNFERQIEYDYLEGTTFTIYELEDGKSAVCPIYDTEANKVFELTATRHGITIGSIASEMAVSQEMDELIVPVIAMVLYGLTGFLLSVLTMKSIHCRHFLSGKPILLIEKGKIYPENLKTAKLDVNDLLSRARTSGYFDISKIYYAILETNGTISFMERATEAPLTPKDLGYEKQDEKLCTDLILDGVIMEDNLKYAGKEIKWLTNEIRKQGCSSPDKVFLCIVDGNDKVTVFPKTQESNKKIYFD